jgi:hypothetical protein
MISTQLCVEGGVVSSRPVLAPDDSPDDEWIDIEDDVTPWETTVIHASKAPPSGGTTTTISDETTIKPALDYSELELEDLEAKYADLAQEYKDLGGGDGGGGKSPPVLYITGDDGSPEEMDTVTELKKLSDLQQQHARQAAAYFKRANAESRINHMAAEKQRQEEEHARRKHASAAEKQRLAKSNKSYVNSMAIAIINEIQTRLKDELTDMSDPQYSAEEKRIHDNTNKLFIRLEYLMSPSTDPFVDQRVKKLLEPRTYTHPPPPPPPRVVVPRRPAGPAPAFTPRRSERQRKLYN